jgi:hypothetical protein
MKMLVLGAVAAVATLAAGAATAQPYGYRYGGGQYYDNGYDHGRYDRDVRRYRDSDRDGVPDRREWNRDRDRDGRPDQWDRHDNRRDRSWHGRHDRRYESYSGYRW